MTTLIIHNDADPRGKVAAALTRIGRWLAARNIAHNYLAADMPRLATAATQASAIVSIDRDGDGGALSLAERLKTLPNDALHGKPLLRMILCSSPITAAGDTSCSRLRLEFHGAEILIKPVLLNEPHALDSELSADEVSRIEDGMLALMEGISFCKRLRGKRESVALAGHFLHAPILA